MVSFPDTRLRGHRPVSRIYSYTRCAELSHPQGCGASMAQFGTFCLTLSRSYRAFLKDDSGRCARTAFWDVARGRLTRAVLTVARPSGVSNTMCSPRPTAFRLVVEREFSFRFPVPTYNKSHPKWMAFVIWRTQEDSNSRPLDS
jgi:hypothetical protein